MNYNLAALFSFISKFNIKIWVKEPQKSNKPQRLFFNCNWDTKRLQQRYKYWSKKLIHKVLRAQVNWSSLENNKYFSIISNQIYFDFLLVIEYYSENMHRINDSNSGIIEVVPIYNYNSILQNQMKINKIHHKVR